MLSTAERMKFDARFQNLFAVNPQQVIVQSERHQFGIDKVGIGGVIRLAGELFTVKKTAKYTEVDSKGKVLDYVVTELELISLRNGETRYLEWSHDDHLEVYFTERKLTKAELNRELRDNEGAPFDVDEDIDECVDKGWSIRFQGVEYPYDDDWSARFISSDGRKGDVYFYEFGTERVGYLTIEGWQSRDEWDYEGFLSHPLQPEVIEVISVGGT